MLPALAQVDLPRWETPLVRSGNEENASESLTVEELAAIRDEARRQGFEEGQREGLRAGETEIRARVERLEKLLSEMAQPFKKVEQKALEQLVSLAGGIAEKLVRRELNRDPDLILATIQEAVRMLSASVSRVSLRLHPEDLALVNQQADASTRERHWILVEDPYLSRGECLLESDLEFVDASIAARINSVLTQLLDADVAALSG